MFLVYRYCEHSMRESKVTSPPVTSTTTSSSRPPLFRVHSDMPASSSSSSYLLPPHARSSHALTPPRASRARLDSSDLEAESEALPSELPRLARSCTVETKKVAVTNTSEGMEIPTALPLFLRFAYERKKMRSCAGHPRGLLFVMLYVD
jgi:hypothetical protein